MSEDRYDISYHAYWVDVHGDVRGDTAGCGCCGDSERLTSVAIDKTIKELQEAIAYLRAKRIDVTKKELQG